MVTNSYTPIEKEIVILAAVWELIGAMVHYGHFMKDHKTIGAQMMFRDAVCAKQFLIILADFLSLPKDGAFGLRKPNHGGCLGETYLGHLVAVAVNPMLCADAVALSAPVQSFAAWLDGEAVVEKVWLPSIEWEGTLRIRRMTFLKICGTLSKHGFTRLDQTMLELRRALAKNRVAVDQGQAYLLIPDFKTWFLDHVFMYHATTIAAFLNDIRWGIYDYLLSEFARSYTPTQVVQGLQMYEYSVPQGISDPLVRSMYWDLMNDIRSPPYVPRFTVSPALQGQF